MLISLKLFIWYLSRKFVRVESPGKGVAVEKAERWLVGKGSMQEHHLCTIFKLYTNSFCRTRAVLQVFIKVTVEPIFLLYLSLTSELWLRSWVWPNCWVSPEFLHDLTPIKNEVKWQIVGLHWTTALCAVLRELFLIHLSLSFYFDWRECSEHDRFKL